MGAYAMFFLQCTRQVDDTFLAFPDLVGSESVEQVVPSCVACGTGV